VDVETAAIILGNVRKLSVGRTTIMVSHRISHVKYADLIVVLENGEMADAGTHEELIGRRGFYSRTYYWQEIEEGRGEVPISGIGGQVSAKN